MNRHGGKRNGSGRNKKPDPQKKVPIPASAEQWKLDRLLKIYGTKKNIREVYSKLTDSIIYSNQNK